VWRQLQRIDPPDRDRKIMKLAESNPVVRDVIREMPRELAGVANSTYDEIRRRRVARRCARRRHVFT